MADKTNDILLACTVGDLSWLKRGLYSGVAPYSTDGEVFQPMISTACVLSKYVTISRVLQDCILQPKLDNLSA